MSSRIIQINNAPLPTPDPWAGDPDGIERCPACAVVDPGAARCKSCGAPLRVRIKRARIFTANLANLIVVLIGRGPMLLAIAFLYRPLGTPLITPWTISLAIQLPLFILCAAGLFMRWRWAWFLAFAIAGLDLLGEIALQLIMPGNPVLPIAAILTDLMVIGFLFTVYDEVRIDTAPIALPEETELPKTAGGAYDMGVSYSRAGQWYFAARLWQRAAALHHVEGRYRRALGLAYTRLKQYDAAESELRAAQWLMPDDAQTRDLLDLLARQRHG